MFKNNLLRHLLPIALCFVLSFCLPMAGQEPPPTAPQTAAPAASPDTPYVLHETSREVVLDVVARDKNGSPVNDLAANEFQIFDVGKGAGKDPKHILSMRIIESRGDPSVSKGNERGFSIRSGAACALRMTTHYQLAIQAASEAGFHEIAIKSTRAQISLSYRRHYYVGGIPKDSASKERKGSSESIALGDAACFHSLFPPSIAVTAHAIVIPGGKSTRYQLIVRPESLANIGLSGTNTQVHLDFGMCTFDASGDLGPYYHMSSDRQLTPEQLANAQAKGYGSLLDIPGDTPYLVRLVVRDHETGNLGIADVSRPVSLEGQGKFTPPPVGTIRAFGVVTPLPNSFCGDVYEVSDGTEKIPEFWNLDPIGSIYTNALNVVDQEVPPGTPGLPGVTRSIKWFGVDYYGEFYITKPGEYKFDLESDDGSRLEIDDKQIINNDELHSATSRTAKITLAVGKHTIHVPYFQGSPPGVALILTIKPPGEGTRPFNLNEFAAPAPVAAAPATP
jgi:PA14 domain